MRLSILYFLHSQMDKIVAITTTNLLPPLVNFSCISAREETVAAIGYYNITTCWFSVGFDRQATENKMQRK